MNRALLSVLVLALASAGDSQPLPLTLRVLTYNIRHGEGTDGRFDLPRLAEVIQSVEPDLVALQELDQGTDRAGGVNQLTELGRLTGMYAVFGKAMDFSGGSYGVGILSRLPPVGVTVQPLPGLPDREPRTTLTVEVPLGKLGAVVFISTHMDQGREGDNRMAQAAFLNQLSARDGPPVILAGDMNSRAGSEVMQILDAQWIDASAAAALPAAEASRGPRPGLDHILLRPRDRWSVIEARLVDAPLASDHRPLLVVLER